MKLLLDTHAFIWWDAEPAKLSAAVLSALQDPANDLLLSTASVWELVIKVQLGKLSLQTPLATLLVAQQANGIKILPVSLDHVLAVQQLPLVHKDPFDRLLAAQSLAENALLVSNDVVFAQYPIQRFWCYYPRNGRRGDDCRAGRLRITKSAL